MPENNVSEAASIKIWITKMTRPVCDVQGRLFVKHM